MQDKEARTDNPIRLRNGGVFAPDDRVENLLRIFSELECFESSLSREQFSELLQQASMACGFADPREACESLIGQALFGWGVSGLYCHVA